MYSRFVVDHVDDGVGRVRDQIAHDLLVAVPGRVVQARLAAGVDRQQRVALHVEVLKLCFFFFKRK